MASVLAIDHGEKKSGFAVADPTRTVVAPLAAVRLPGDGAELVEHVAVLLGERDVDVLLVGLPVNADGSEGERARSVRRFATRLAERFPEAAVLTHDEHLTTKEAEARLREAGHRGRRAAARRDSWSALVLLEDWIRSGEPRG